MLYAVFSTLAGLAVLGLLVIRPTPSLSPSHSRAAVEPLNLLETVRILFERRFRLLLPAMCYSGFSASFITVLYTAYIGTQWVGLTMVGYGCVQVLGSLVGGRISDRVGRTPVFLIGCACTLAGVVVACISPENVATLQEGAWMYFLAYVFLGMGDSAFNTQVQSALGAFMKKNTQPAFAAYRFILSVTSMTGSIAGSYINLTYLSAPWQILLPCVVLWSVLFVAVLCWVILDLFVERISDPEGESSNTVQ